MYVALQADSIPIVADDVIVKNDEIILTTPSKCWMTDAHVTEHYTNVAKSAGLTDEEIKADLAEMLGDHDTMEATDSPAIEQ
jgi:hypothetical protein